MGGKAKGLILSVVLIVIALLLLPIVISGSHAVVTDTITETFAATVVAATAADVVLTNDPLDDKVAWVTGITATGAGAVPVANTYTTGTNTLNITGLGAVTPQDITVTYDYEVNADYSGVNAITNLVPLLVVVGLILVGIINGIWTLKKN